MDGFPPTPSPSPLPALPWRAGGGRGGVEYCCCGLRCLIRRHVTPASHFPPSRTPTAVYFTTLLCTNLCNPPPPRPPDPLPPPPNLLPLTHPPSPRRSYMNSMPVDVMRGLMGVDSVIVVDVEGRDDMGWRNLAPYDGGLSGWRLLWDRWCPVPRWRLSPGGAGGAGAGGGGQVGLCAGGGRAACGVEAAVGEWAPCCALLPRAALLSSVPSCPFIARSAPPPAAPLTLRWGLTTPSLRSP